MEKLCPTQSTIVKIKVEHMQNPYSYKKSDKLDPADRPTLIHATAIISEVDNEDQVMYTSEWQGNSRSDSPSAFQKRQTPLHALYSTCQTFRSH